MKTIAIKTKSTKVFSWSGFGARGIGENEATGLREAVVAGIQECNAYVRGRGAGEGIQACLVTWEDGDELSAFLYELGSEIPRDLPWVLMQTQPSVVTRRES